MKTERRQELRSNDLSAFLLDTYDWGRDHAVHVGGAVALVVVILLTTAYVRRSRTGEMDAASQTLSQLRFSGEDAEQSFQTLNTLIADTTDRDFKMTALLQKGERSLDMAVGTFGKVDGHYLDGAESAYQQLRTQYPDRMPVVATALHALATVEENRFVMDGDLRHREKARSYLEQLVSGVPFRGTPFQTRAAERIKNQDNTFRTVTIAPAEAGPPVPIEPTIVPPTEVDRLQIEPSPDEGGQLIRIPPPTGLPQETGTPGESPDDSLGAEEESDTADPPADDDGN